MKRLQNKVTAITGAGDGIGRAAAEVFAAEGAKTVILEINEKKGLEVEQAIIKNGGEALFIKTDVSDYLSVQNAFEQIDKTYGQLNTIYNNASVFLGKQDAPLGELELDVWNKILSINLNSIFYCCKHGIPLLKKSGGGVIINTSSSAGLIGIPKCDSYTATKGATISLTKSLAVEYGPYNIRTNCIAPAAIYTPMVGESNLSDPDFDEQKFLNTTPVRRWGKPEEIAKIALFLASDESSYLNGAIIVADGGITIT